MTRSTMTVLFYLIMIIILIYTRLIYDLYYVLLDRDCSIYLQFETIVFKIWSNWLICTYYYINQFV